MSVGHDRSSIVGVVDCGIGNSRSLVGALSIIGVEVRLLHDPEESRRCTHIVLPGVGHFSAYIEYLNDSGLGEAIQAHAIELQKPLLGICVGAQILGSATEESNRTGLGFVPMTTKRLATKELRVPNIGWHTTHWKSSVRPYLGEVSLLYYSHSFVLHPDQASDELATICYGVSEVVAVQHNNIVGVQFHPEKSYQCGSQFLRWFVELPA